MISVITLLAQCSCRGGGASSATGQFSDFAILLVLALIVVLYKTVKWAKSTWEKEGTTKMRRLGKIGLIVILVAGIFTVIWSQLADAKQPTPTATEKSASPSTLKLPKLLDLGSKKCIPCKKMAPILEELTKEYAGIFNVEFIDVWVKENAEKAIQFGISSIPTQIFFDADGKELWRHTGFFSKDEILAKWKELGYDFSKTTAAKRENINSDDNETINEAYPNLASAALVNAKIADLPEGILLRTDKISITRKELDTEITKAPEAMQGQFGKNAFFILEQMATKQLLFQEAKAAAAKDGKDVSKLSEKEIISGYFDKLTADLAVTDAEANDFYEKNKDMCGGQELKDIRGSIDNYILNQKKQEIVEKQIQSLGKKDAIEVDAAWLKQQAELAADNPVDKARNSGKPSLIDFGSKGCRPCDMLAPILETLKKKYDGKANVLFISVRDEQILAARYGIQSIPVQIFFDKDGKEVFRHTGFWPQEELEKKFAEMGVK